MKKREVLLFFKRLSIFLSPFLLLILSFVIIDPFKIISTYDDFNNSITALNPDYVSTEVYLKNREKEHYNSFIFGSSKTLAYKTREWKKYLSSQDVPFVFHASYESLFGITTKIEYIHSKGDQLKNVLIILDQTVLFQTQNNYTHLGIKDPRTSGESKLVFYNTYFKAYLSNLFFVKSIDYALFQKKRAYLNDVIASDETYYDPISNDLFPSTLIQTSERIYRTPLTPVQKYDQPIIGAIQVDMLERIRNVFREQKTNYKIIIGPQYNCYSLAPEDIKKLETIFGKESIYDFSGVNTYTTNIHNYYDTWHYSIETGKNILRDIYIFNIHKKNY